MKFIEPKEDFLKRMQLLLNKEDYEKYLKEIKKPSEKSIRVNTIKISSKELVKKLKEKNWKIEQPWKDYPETIIIKDSLEPGELGRTFEHLLGYYYVQSLASMLSIIALSPKENEIILDLCASPGSKTTQIIAKTKNTGTVIGNDISLGRIKILSSNIERCGGTNSIITKKEGVAFCKKMQKNNFKFDKILIDAPCSGEGTLRNNPKTALMWNENKIKKLSNIQKNLLEEGIKTLKTKGEIVYSTCTHGPEENEEIINYILEKYPNEIEIQKIELPIKTHSGILKWKGKKYNDKVSYCHRIYPHDTGTEGFFIAKLKKIGEIK